jgi:hypothetical protein
MQGHLERFVVQFVVISLASALGHGGSRIVDSLVWAMDVGVLTLAEAASRLSRHFGQRHRVGASSENAVMYTRGLGYPELLG